MLLIEKAELIMFDLDGTLLDLAFDNFFWKSAVIEHWANIHQCTLHHATATLLPLMKGHEGTLNWYSIPFWSETLGFDVGQLKHQHRHRIALHNNAQHVLNTLKRQNKPMWLVTNAHPIALDIKLTQTNLAPYFSKIISSANLAHPKENIHFWHTLKAQHPFNIKNTLFIDDNQQVLDTAAAYGIKYSLGIAQPDSGLAAGTNLPKHHLRSLAELLTLEV